MNTVYEWEGVSITLPTPPSLVFRALITVYSVFSVLALPLFWSVRRRRLKQGKEDAGLVQQRMGKTDSQKPDGTIVWIHSASIGETRMAMVLARQLLSDHPNIHIVLTTQTLSASQFVKNIPQIIHQMAPFDYLFYVKRFLDHWQPTMGFVIESERWPNLLYQAFKRHIPLVGINTQISLKSIRFWKYCPWFFSGLLKLFSALFTPSMRTQDLLKRFSKNLPVYIAPSLKYVVQTPLFSGLEKIQAKTLYFKGRLYWLASCIHASESELVIKTHELLLQYYPELLLVVIPRHPSISIPWPKAAYWSKENDFSDHTQIYVIDVFGQTQNFYHQALFCVLGGSLEPIGGHNIAEPVAEHCAVIHGPHTYHCPELYATFTEQNASCLVYDATTLCSAVKNFLDHPACATEQAERAFIFQQRNQEHIQLYLGYLSSLSFMK